MLSHLGTRGIPGIAWSILTSCIPYWDHSAKGQWPFARSAKMVKSTQRRPETRTKGTENHAETGDTTHTQVFMYHHVLIHGIYLSLVIELALSFLLLAISLFTSIQTGSSHSCVSNSAVLGQQSDEAFLHLLLHQEAIRRATQAAKRQPGMTGLATHFLVPIRFLWD